jgi:hypothetical protein
VVVVEGTQGVGKTNLLNHFEADIRDALSDRDEYYVVRYLADPEKSFDGTIRRLFQELGEDHIKKLASALGKDEVALDVLRGNDRELLCFRSLTLRRAIKTAASCAGASWSGFSGLDCSSSIVKG